MRYYYLLKSTPSEELANMKLENFNFSSEVLYELHRSKIYKDGKFVPKIRTVGDLLKLKQEGLDNLLKKNGHDIDERDSIIQEVNEKFARIGLKFEDNDFTVGDCRISCLDLPPKVMTSIMSLQRKPKTFDDLLIIGVHRLEKVLSSYFLDKVYTQLEKYGLKIEGSSYILQTKNFFTIDEFKEKTDLPNSEKKPKNSAKSYYKPISFEELKKLSREEILAQPIEALRLYAPNINLLHDLNIFTISDLVNNAFRIKSVESGLQNHNYYNIYVKLKSLGIGFGYDNDMKLVTYKNGKTMISYALTNAAPDPFDVSAASEEEKQKFFSTPVSEFGFCRDIVECLPMSCKTIGDLLKLTPKELEQKTLTGHRIRHRLVGAMHLYNLEFNHEEHKKSRKLEKKPYIDIDLKTATDEQKAEFMKTSLYDAGLYLTTSKNLAKIGIETVQDILRADNFIISNALNAPSQSSLKRFLTNYGLELKKGGFESFDEDVKVALLNSSVKKLGISPDVVVKLVNAGYEDRIGSICEKSFTELEKNISRSAAASVNFALKKIGLSLKKEDKTEKSETKRELKNVYPKIEKQVVNEKTAAQGGKKAEKKVIAAKPKMNVQKPTPSPVSKIMPKPYYLMSEEELNAFLDAPISIIGLSSVIIDRFNGEKVHTIKELLSRDIMFINRIIPTSSIPKTKMFFERYSIPLNRNNGFDTYRFAIDEKPFETFSNEEKEMFLNAKLSNIGMGQKKIEDLQKHNIRTVGDLMNSSIYEVRAIVSKETMGKIEDFFKKYNISMLPQTLHDQNASQEQILATPIELLNFENDVVEALKNNNIKTIGDMIQISEKGFARIVNKTKQHPGVAADARKLLATFNLSFASEVAEFSIPFSKRFDQMNEEEKQQFLNFKLADIKGAGVPLKVTLANYGIVTIGDALELRVTDIGAHVNHANLARLSQLFKQYGVDFSRNRRIFSDDLFERYKKPIGEMAEEEKLEFLSTPITDVGFSKRTNEKFDKLNIKTLADLFMLDPKKIKEQFTASGTKEFIQKLDDFYGIRAELKNGKINKNQLENKNAERETLKADFMTLTEEEKKKFEKKPLAEIGIFSKLLEENGIVTIGDARKCGSIKIRNIINASKINEQHVIDKLFEFGIIDEDQSKLHKEFLKKLRQEELSDQEKAELIESDISIMKLGKASEDALRSAGINKIADFRNKRRMDIANLTSNNLSLRIHNYVSKLGIDMEVYGTGEYMSIKYSDYRNDRKNKIDAALKEFEGKTFENMSETEKQAFKQVKLDDLGFSEITNKHFKDNGFMCIGDIINISRKHLKMLITSSVQYKLIEEILENKGVRLESNVRNAAESAKVRMNREKIRTMFMGKTKENMSESEKQTFLNIDLNEIGLSISSIKTLNENGIKTIGDALKRNSKQLKELLNKQQFRVLQDVVESRGYWIANEPMKYEDPETIKVSELEDELRKSGLSALFKLPYSCFVTASEDLAEIVDIVDDYIDERANMKENVRADLTNIANKIISSCQSMGESLKTRRFKNYRSENLPKNIVLNGRVKTHFEKPIIEDNNDFDSIL